jgi:hypothetical protein
MGWNNRSQCALSLALTARVMYISWGGYRIAYLQMQEPSYVGELVGLLVRRWKISSGVRVRRHYYHYTN